MAERCLECGQKISKLDVAINAVTECPECKNQYHDACWLKVDKCLKCGHIIRPDREQQRKEAEVRRHEAEAIRLAQEQARQKAEQEQREALRKAEQERYQARINHLKATGRDGYYEYKVISLVDKKGAVDTQRLMNELNDLGLDGWRLQCAYTNEMGKDSLSIAGFGINSTADQNILIFERFVKFE